MVLNSSYGFDIKNNENFDKVKICTYNQTNLHTNQISDDLFMVHYKPKSFKCDTPIQCGYFTLDNAKFAYLSFYYEFLTKCMDMNRIHAIEGEQVMVKNLINKVAISGIHTKMVVLENQSCAPYIYGMNADSYVCI
jgi:hypothetical protein